MHNSMRRFTSLLFYDHPVELEPCGNDDFLGNVLDMFHNRFTYKVPQDECAYRSCHSAGSTNRVLSGLNARLHLLFRATFPRSLAPQLLSQLIAKYEAKGFPHQVLSKMSFKVSSKYKIAVQNNRGAHVNLQCPSGRRVCDHLPLQETNK